MVVLEPLREVGGFLLSGAAGLAAGYALSRSGPEHSPLAFLLPLRVLGAWAFGWLYAAYYCFGDTLKVYLTAQRIAHYLMESPETGLALLFREFSSKWEAIGWRIFYKDAALFGYDYEWSEPSNYNFYRLSVLFYFLGGGSYYGMQGMYAIVGGILLYRAWQRWAELGALPKVGVWVWMGIPSSLFWISGALRDTLALPLMLYGAALLARGTLREGIQAVPLLALGYFLRPESVGVALGGALLYRLGAFYLTLVGAVGAALVLLPYGIAPWAYQYRSWALDPRMYPDLPTASVFYITFQPTFWGSWSAWLQALLHVLWGPFPWHIHRLRELIYASEVWLLSSLGLLLSIYAVKWRGWSSKTFLLAAFGLFILGVIGLATPYWGSLARQRLYGLYWVLLGVGMAVGKALEQRQNAFRHS
ncbi:MAG: hypothetical protein ABDH91_00755 [Bacteroidia bacterium]